MNEQRGFFDEQDRLQKISLQDDPLEKLNTLVDWEMFRSQLKRFFKTGSLGQGLSAASGMALDRILHHRRRPRRAFPRSSLASAPALMRDNRA